MRTARSLQSIPVLLVLVILAMLLPPPSLSSPTGDCPEIRLYPSGQIEAEHKDGFLVISSLVGVEGREPGRPVEFTIRLTAGDVITEVTRLLPPEEVGLDVLFLADLDPSLLTVPPGTEEHKSYYLALVWLGVLRLFHFAGSANGIDRGRMAMPPAGDSVPVASENEGGNLFLDRLPDLATMPVAEAKSQVGDLLDTWLRHETPRPRMAVILRWQMDPVTSTEYDFANPQRIPIVVVDVGRLAELHALEIQRAGGEVASLGPTPKVVAGYWPNPSDYLRWENDERQIPAQVEKRLSNAIHEQIAKTQSIFVLEEKWPLLIDSSQLPDLQLALSTQVHNVPIECTFPVYFTSGSQGGGEKVLGAIALAAFITSTALFFILSFWLALFIKPIRAVVREARKVGEGR